MPTISQLFDLTGRVAIVTGGSRGLGLEMAEGLAEAGAALMLCARREEWLTPAVTELRGRGFRVEGALCDVAKPQDVQTVVDRTVAAFGAVDILINNAGVSWGEAPEKMPLDKWQKVLDVNLTSAFVIGREAAKRMIPRGRGKVINIGSLTSTLARATVAPYTVAKGGIKMLTQAMAAEWAAHGIQANAIGPGYMITDMNQALIDNPSFDAWVKNRTPSKRWGRPDELIGAAVFLASPASDYVNGQIIFVDGGMTAIL